jgi:hypothetical protein
VFIIENVVHRTSFDIDLTSADGDVLNLHLEGDCCSSSFFDDDSVLDVKSLLGERLMDVESVAWDCPVPDVNGDCQCSTGMDDETIHSALIIKTDRQSITLMWRNESNGYYSGYLECYLNGNKLDNYGSDSRKMKDVLS